MDKRVLKERIENLKFMDKYARRNFANETNLDYWFTMGVPDGADKTDLKEIAEDTESYNDICHRFVCIMKWERK